MPLSPEQLEQPYFIPTGENVSQILAELNTVTQRASMTIPTIQLSNICPYRESQDFSFHQLHNGYHWQGEGRYENVCSEDGFPSIEEAASDVIFWLHRANDYDMQSSHALVQSLGLPWLDQPELDLILEDC